MSDIFDALNALPIPYKDWIIPVLVVLSAAYRMYKRLEPLIYRKTLTKGTVEAIEAFTSKAGLEPDSPVAKALEEARTRYAFYQVSNMDVKDPLRSILAKLYLTLPETDWAGLKEARPYIKVSEGEQDAISIHVPWFDAVGNCMSILTGILLVFMALLFMLLIPESARDAQNLAFLLLLAVLCLAGGGFFFITGVPPIRAVQLRKRLLKLKESPVKLIPSESQGRGTHLAEKEEVVAPSIDRDTKSKGREEHKSEK